MIPEHFLVTVWRNFCIFLLRRMEYVAAGLITMLVLETFILASLYASKAQSGAVILHGVLFTVVCLLLAAAITQYGKQRFWQGECDFRYDLVYNKHGELNSLVRESLEHQRAQIATLRSSITGYNFAIKRYQEGLEGQALGVQSLDDLTIVQPDTPAKAVKAQA